MGGTARGSDRFGTGDDVAIKSTIRDPSITLSHIFSGAFPFTVIMLFVLILIIIFPQISLALL